MMFEAAGHVVSVASDEVHSLVWKIVAHTYREDDNRRIVVKWREADTPMPPMPGAPVHVTVTVDTEETR